ncbi:hypothetical protein Tco_1293527 [Tanacetum coccineum]
MRNRTILRSGMTDKKRVIHDIGFVDFKLSGRMAKEDDKKKAQYKVNQNAFRLRTRWKCEYCVVPEGERKPFIRGKKDGGWTRFHDKGCKIVELSVPCLSCYVSYLELWAAISDHGLNMQLLAIFPPTSY